MNVIYLKAPDRSALLAALEAAGMIRIDWLVLDASGSEVAARDVMDDAIDAADEIGGKAVKRVSFKPAHPGDALDEIGTIYRGTGKFSEIDGEQVEQQEAVEGYHANLLLHGGVPDALKAIQITTPATPRRVFAGVN